MSHAILQQIKDADRGKEWGPLQIKYKAMEEDAFRFFRGTCSLFYADLLQQYPFPPSPDVWACGDLHIENFGSYKSSQRLIYFDLNDFDEALLAPALWEIARLATSVHLGAEQAEFSKKKAAYFVNILLDSYRYALKNGKALVTERDTARGVIKKLFNKVADRKDADLVKKRTNKDSPGKLVTSDKLLAFDNTQEKKLLVAAFNDWLSHNDKKLRVNDAVFRIAGTGGLGLKRYLLLLEHINDPQNKLLVDLKQAFPSATAKYVNTMQPAWDNDADRIITVQGMMQYMSPAFLSTFQHNDNWFVVKELQPMAEKVELKDIISQPDHTESYFSDLGNIAASGQLRSSGRKGSATADELIDFAEDERWISIVAGWTERYAGQVNREHSIFRQAWKDGFFAK